MTPRASIVIPARDERTRIAGVRGIRPAGQIYAAGPYTVLAWDRNLLSGLR